MKQTVYKALQNCRVDTFRKKGDVFLAETFDECPHFLEEVEPIKTMDEGQPEPPDELAEQPETVGDNLTPAKKNSGKK